MAYTVGYGTARLINTYDISHFLPLYGRVQTQATYFAATSQTVAKIFSIPTGGFTQFDPLGVTKAYNAVAYSQINVNLNIPLNLLFPQSFFDLDLVYIRDTLEIRLITNPVSKILC